MKNIALVLVGIVAGFAAGFIGFGTVQDTRTETTEVTIKNTASEPQVASPFAPVAEPVAEQAPVTAMQGPADTSQVQNTVSDTPANDITHYRELAAYLQHINSLEPQQLESLLDELSPTGHDATFTTTLSTAIYQRWAEQDLNAALEHAIATMDSNRGYHSSLARNAIIQLGAQYPDALSSLVSKTGNTDSELQYLANQGIVARNPEGFLRDLFESDNIGRHQQDMKMMALMTWAEKDAGAAWEFINTEYPNKLEFYERENLLRMWFEQDPDAAMPEIQAALNSGNTHPEANMMLSELYIRHLSRDDPQAAMQWASSLPNGMQREQAIMNFFYSNENMEPEAMISFIDQLDETDKQRILPMATHAIASNMARTDPLSAMAWAEQLPPMQRNEVQHIALSDWANQDPNAAMDWVMALPETPQNLDLIRSAAHPVIYSDPEAGKLLFEKLPAQMQVEMIEPVISSLSQHGPEVALQWLSEQSNPDVQQRGTLILDIINPDADTYTTLEKLAALPRSNREELMFRFLGERAYMDPDTVNQWLTETNSLAPDEREMYSQMTGGMINRYGNGAQYGGGGYQGPDEIPTDLYQMEYDNERNSE